MLFKKPDKIDFKLYFKLKSVFFCFFFAKAACTDIDMFIDIFNCLLISICFLYYLFFQNDMLQYNQTLKILCICKKNGIYCQNYKLFYFYRISRSFFPKIKKLLFISILYFYFVSCKNNKFIRFIHVFTVIIYLLKPCGKY